MTHCIQYDKNANDKKTQFLREWEENFGWVSSKNTSNSEKKYICNNEKGNPITNYGKESPLEDMSESFALYFIYPEKLKEMSRERFDFIEKELGTQKFKK